MMTIIEIMARSVGARAQQNKNRDVEYLMDQASLERFTALVRADEREVLHSLETDAHFIFNNPPGETSQDVRDVIEWYAASIRARGETK